MKHKWAKEIKAWADGAEIEYTYDDISKSSVWLTPLKTPDWDCKIYKFRIKPQQKEPQYLYVYHKKGEGFTLGYAPYEALNMWETKIVGKIKLENEDGI